jgi:large subunit ribosomal protein L32
MAVPKKKKSKSRRDKGRSHHHLTMPNISFCPKCHEPVLPHHVCMNCGAYNGKSVIHIEKE